MAAAKPVMEARREREAGEAERAAAAKTKSARVPWRAGVRTSIPRARAPMLGATMRTVVGPRCSTLGGGGSGLSGPDGRGPGRSGGGDRSVDGPADSGG